MIKLIKLAIVTILMFIFILIGVVIGVNVNKNKEEPVIKLTGQWEKTMEAGELSYLVEESYWKFVKASYITIGTPPDCSFYKIVSEVPRNNYISSNFYIDDESDFMFYHDNDGNRTSKIAIDVSAYQNDINWENVKAAGVDVAMIRVGYRGYGNGKLVEDEKFRTHVEGALAAGLQVGVYFFTQALNATEGAEEADFVINTISEYDIAGPVVIDSEKLDVEDARTIDLDNEARTDAVVAFCDTVKAAGYSAMIYSNRNWYVQNLDMTRLGGYKLWVAHYTNEPDFPYNYGGWQYTESGTIPGVEGALDLNVWFE